MKRFYSVLCLGSIFCTVVFAVYGLLSHTSLPLTAAVFFTVFAVCTGGMRILLTLSERTDGMWKTVSRTLYLVGTALFSLFLGTFVLVQVILIANAHTDSGSEQAKYLLVLGAGIDGNQPSRTLRSRLTAAMDFAQEHPDCTIIVCGGQAEDEDYPEAYVMEQWLLEHGFPSERILMESQSRTTVENIAFAKRILDEKTDAPYSVSVVSSGFHLFRARHLMKQAGLTPYAIAAPSPWYLRPLLGLREYFSLVKLIALRQW